MNNSNGAAAAVGLFVLLIELVLVAVIIAGAWKVFVKAGHPGWAAIVPFYNIYIVTVICGKPILWFILCLIPCVSIVPAIVLPIELAKRFGKSGAFAVGLIFLPFVFYPILGFGDAVYTPPATSAPPVA